MKKEAPRCVAPVSGATDSSLRETKLCGREATTGRIVEGIECPLCAEHAHEFDTEDQEAKN